MQVSVFKPKLRNFDAMRSKLFVPGSRPEFFPKALASQADALSFDLEDSVAPDRKEQARSTLASWLCREGSQSATSPAKIVIVRINAPDTAWFEEDLKAMAQPGVHLLNVPKLDSPQDVLHCVRLLEAAERAQGVTTPIGLLLNIETPRALRIAHDLASAHPRVAGLQLGLADLFEPLNITRTDPVAVSQAMFAVRLAAGEAGVFAYDTAFADIRDQAGFTAEAQQSRRLGFIGKSCIHPSQVALANAVYQPTAAEVAAAQRVVDAARIAQAQGVGAYVVDGKMIDAPFVRRAEAILAIASTLASAQVSP